MNLYHFRSLMRVVAGVCLLSLCTATVSLAGGITFFPATPYLQAGDANSLFDASWPVTIEDFEDNSVDPFITVMGEILPPNFGTGIDHLTDSVDGDDNAVDGVGNDAYSLFNSGRSIQVTFANAVTSAGLVWTDGDPASSGVMLEAFDAGGMSLGVFNYGDLGDDQITGQTAEDRFIGASDMGGIKSLIVTNLPGGTGIEVDHVQWQICDVPEPAGMALALMATLSVLGLRRRR